MPTSLVSIKPLPEGDRLKGSSNWAPWYMQMKAMLRRMHVLAHADGTDKVLLQYGAHALLEPGVLRLACGAIDGSWRGGLCGSAHIFPIFLRILLTLI
jgi:hypothetical protein